MNKPLAKPNMFLVVLLVIIIVLVLLFFLAKLAFWILLVVVLILLGIWLFKKITTKPLVNSEVKSEH